MPTGTVSQYNDSKGFGFITAADGTGDVFVHHTSINTGEGYLTLVVGKQVKYDTRIGAKGKEAINVSYEE